MTFSLRLPKGPVKVVEGDTRPFIDFTIVDDSEPPVPIDLSGCKVEFVFRKKGDTVFKFRRELFAIDPIHGLVGYNWKVGDLDPAGNYEGELKITFPDGSLQTQEDPTEYKVRSQLGAYQPPPTQGLLTGTPGSWYREALTAQIGDPPGRSDFTTRYKYVLGSLKVYINGLDLGPSGVYFNENSSQLSFSYLGSTLVFGDSLFVEYVVTQ